MRQRGGVPFWRLVTMGVLPGDRRGALLLPEGQYLGWQLNGGGGAGRG